MTSFLRRPSPAIFVALGLLAAAALAGGCGGDGDRLSSGDLPRAAAALRVSSPAFIDGSRLAPRYTCDGAGDEPPAQAGTVPPSTSELVLIVSDPDAPGGTYVHVTRYGISPRGDGSVDHGGREGRNSAGDVGWTAPIYLDQLQEVAASLVHLRTLVVRGDADTAARRFAQWDVVSFRAALFDRTDTPGIPVCPNEVAMLLFTSGTTGRSKAC